MVRTTENYSVSLQPEVVKQAKAKLLKGQSLSPIINELLIKWNEEKKE